MPGNVSQAIASQLEFVRPEMPKLYLLASRLWKRIEARSDIHVVSNRPARIPFEAISGGKFRVMQPDGGDMGTGSGLTEVNGTLSCPFFLQATEWTTLAESSTDNKEKAIEAYVSLNQQRAAKTFAGYMDALLQGDGSDTLDTVVSLSGTQGLVVNNANFFQSNQDVDAWSALGGTFQGTVTIQTVDIANNTLWLTAPTPAAIVATSLLLVNGSAGVANSGLYGLRYYQAAGNTGQYMNIQKSAFPGLFSTPNISVNGSLTPAAVRAMEAQIELAIGVDEADAGDLVCHGNVDMRAAWENNAILVQRVIMNEVKGDQSVDMLKKKAPTEIAGREFLTNERARPGYLDFLALKYWFRLEAQPLDQYEVGGQTIFPYYGTSGGLAAKQIMYLWTGVQVGNAMPRGGAYMNGVTIPHNYFGH